MTATATQLMAASLLHRVRRSSSPGPHRTCVMLHGRSGDENVMWVFARTLPEDWLLVAPRAIKPDPDGGFAWHPRKPDEWPPLPMFAEAVSAVVQFICELPALYNADPRHIYLMGFSQGAALAYATALQHPGLVQGVAGLVGFVPTETESLVKTKPLADRPVFMAVGQQDPLIPLAIAQASARVLREAGADLDYHAYPTVHKLDLQGMRDLTSWWKERDR